MNWAERVLAAITGLFLIIAIGCSFAAGILPDSGFTVDGGGVPFAFLVTQFITTIAPHIALIGLAGAVGLLFLRALHWHPLTEQEPED
ncbi:MAG: hypothetical protein JWN09_757 [Microbacteriaceae bacterium]|jgi:hypothetical protein|nr:hypothetical protein [Microbacteriaceae bacterium]